MSRASEADIREEIRDKIPKGGFRLSHLFPLFNGGHAPFPKQELIFEWTRSGVITGAGAVYQGGKGSCKTITGAAWIIWCHHVPKWQGMRSLIGRETYPALCTSTADEFFTMVEMLPDNVVHRASKPSKNSMGFVEWSVGGVTLLCSLKDSNTWESANLGAAWVDEGHRQNPRVIGDLETRLRQNDSPRALLITQNPGGKGWLWRIANPDSPKYRKGWKWVEATTLENPSLPPDYHERLKSRYGFNTPAYKRWVLGSSAALEGTVFTELIPEVEHLMHVVPAFDLPDEGFRWGRGLDYGMVNPTAVVWGAKDPWGNWWIDRLHYAPAEPEMRDEWTVPLHAEAILEIDGTREIEMIPADPSIWIRNREDQATGIQYSTADEFEENGVMLEPANNNRESGLQALLDLFAIDPDRCHPFSLQRGSPSIFILDREENEPLLREMGGLLWAKAEGTTEAGRPDDVQKKADHSFDGLRYLVMESPPADKEIEIVIPERIYQTVGTRGRTRRY